MMFTQGTSPSAKLRAGSKGQALIIVLVIVSAMLFAGMIFLRSVLSEATMASLFIAKEKAFYVAEAGLEDGRSIIAANPNWFTDNPHSPNDDASWLIDAANGSIKQFGGGSYKIVRESGKNIIYSVGQFKAGKSVVRIKFNINPFKAYEFMII